MVMSDRIALLRSGELEQVATPREIYNRPATAYVAQFIGHTNLLKGEVKDGSCVAANFHGPLRCLTDRRSSPCGRSIIRLAGIGSASVRVRGRVLQQAFHGATELIRVDCADSFSSCAPQALARCWMKSNLSFLARTPSRSASRRRELNVFSRLQDGRHRAAAGVGHGVSARALPADVLLQLLVGVAVADHRAFLESRQL